MTSNWLCGGCWVMVLTLSASSIGRLRAQWEEELETWRERRLDDRELV